MLAVSPKSVCSPTRRFLSFLDILGFSGVVNRVSDDPTIAERIEGAVDEALYWVRDCKPHPTGAYRWKLRTFSDCLMFSQPETPLGLLNMFEAVAYLVRRMIVRELPVRGAITLGDHIQFKLTVPSPALLSAYELEQAAIFPRVLLSSDIIAYTASPHGEFTPELSQYITFDQNGHAFLNHLITDDDDEMHLNSSFLKVQRRFLLKTLSEELSADVSAKYLWLAAFHDWCVRSASWTELDDELIRDSELLVGAAGSHARFVSLWHILYEVSARDEEKREVDWKGFLDATSWPFNYRSMFDEPGGGPFGMTVKLLHPSKTWRTELLSD